MQPATAENVENWLRQHAGWVTREHICSRWDISDRRLRLVGTQWLVSRNEGGYIHLDNATPQELEAYCGPELAHSRTLRRKIFAMRKRYWERRLHRAAGAELQPELL